MQPHGSEATIAEASARRAVPQVGITVPPTCRIIPARVMYIPVGVGQLLFSIGRGAAHVVGVQRGGNTSTTNERTKLPRRPQ